MAVFHKVNPLLLPSASKATSRLGARVWHLGMGTNVNVALQWCPYKNLSTVPGYDHSLRGKYSGIVPGHRHLSAQDYISAMFFTHVSLVATVRRSMKQLLLQMHTATKWFWAPCLNNIHNILVPRQCPGLGTKSGRGLGELLNLLFDS